VIKLFKYISIYFILRLILNKYSIGLIILLFLGIYFIPDFLISNYISNVTGTKAKTDIRLFELLRGNIYFEKVTIFSSASYSGAVALQFYDLKVDLSLYHILDKQKIINSIKTNEIIINSIYHNGSNNIQEIQSNLQSFYKHRPSGKVNSDYLIKVLFLRNIHIQTYYYTSKPVFANMPNIYVTDIDSKSHMTRTVFYVLTAALSSSIMSVDSKNISFWTKAYHGMAGGLNLTTNLINAGFYIAGKSLDAAESIGTTFNK